MAILLSTGLRNALATDGSLSSNLSGNIVAIYSGPVPLSANASVGTSELLCSVCAEGIEFEQQAINGVLMKSIEQAWSGVNAANGVASYFRIQSSSDSQAASDYEIRLQGTVGQIGTDLEVSNANLETGNTLSINSAVFSIPERS